MLQENAKQSYTFWQTDSEYPEQPIIIEVYEGCISLNQNGNDVLLSTEHLLEFIKELKTLKTKKEAKVKLDS